MGRIRLGHSLQLSAVLLLALACGRSQKATVQFQLNSSGLHTTSVNELPANYCYFIQITGDRLTQHAPAEDTCGPEHGTGFLLPTTYKKGDTAQFDISVGSRHFDLVGFKAPGGSDANCAPLNFLFDGTQPEGKRSIFQMAGQPVSNLVLFYAGNADVLPGPNVITLDAQPLESLPMTASLTFGAAFLQGSKANPPAVCHAPVPVQLQPHIFAVSGGGISQPVASTNNSGIKLKSISISPVMGHIPTGGQIFKGGFQELEHGK